MEGKVCTKCKQRKLLEEFNKNKHHKDGRQYECRECQKERKKQWSKNNPEYSKQWRKDNPEYYKIYFNSEQQKQYREVNKEKKKEYDKQYRKDNAEHRSEYYKQWRENNPEYRKQHYQDNAEHYKQYSKQRYQDNAKHNLQYISNVVEQINPVFKQLNLPVYGYVYMFKNTKTDHIYIGQTIQPLKVRYKSNIIKGWIGDRLKYNGQKFKEELIEEDIVVTEVLDVAFCQYHLDKLETYYIQKYDSCNNGYNNEYGNHNTNDGLEEFQQILSTHNLEYKDGKIIKKPTSTNEID